MAKIESFVDLYWWKQKKSNLCLGRVGETHLLLRCLVQSHYPKTNPVQGASTDPSTALQRVWGLKLLNISSLGMCIPEIARTDSKAVPGWRRNTLTISRCSRKHLFSRILVLSRGPKLCRGKVGWLLRCISSVGSYILELFFANGEQPRQAVTANGRETGERGHDRADCRTHVKS